MPTVRIKNNKICNRSTNELPVPNTRANTIIAKISFNTIAVCNVNPIRVDSISISANNRIAIVVDVARKIAPTAILWMISIPKSSPNKQPAINGIITPKTPTENPAFLFFFKSAVFVSSPTINKRKITPMNASSLNSGEVRFNEKLYTGEPKRFNDIPENAPNKEGPRIIPAIISPMTPGCLIFSKIILKILANIIASVISNSIQRIPY